MNVIGVQLVLLFFGFFMIYILFLYWKKQDISNVVFFNWLLVWLSFIFFSLFPKVLEPLIKELFIIRVMDLGMIAAFMILTYLSIENNIKIKKYKKMLEGLVREMAMKNEHKKK